MGVDQTTRFSWAVAEDALVVVAEASAESETEAVAGAVGVSETAEVDVCEVLVAVLEAGALAVVTVEAVAAPTLSPVVVMDCVEKIGKNVAVVVALVVAKVDAVLDNLEVEEA